MTLSKREQQTRRAIEGFARAAAARGDDLFNDGVRVVLVAGNPANNEIILDAINETDGWVDQDNEDEVRWALEAYWAARARATT